MQGTRTGQKQSHDGYNGPDEENKKLLKIYLNVTKWNIENQKPKAFNLLTPLAK